MAGIVVPLWTIANIYFVEGTQTTIGSEESCWDDDC